MALLSSVKQILHRVISPFEAVLVFLSGVLLVAMVAMVAYSVVMRYAFGSPVAWAVQFAGYIVLALAFLPGSWVTKQGEHIRLDLVLNLVKPAQARVITRLGYLVAGIICTVLFWFGLSATADHYARRVMILDFVSFPKFYLLAIIAVGSLFLALRSFERSLPESSHRK